MAQKKPKAAKGMFQGRVESPVPIEDMDKAIEEAVMEDFNGATTEPIQKDFASHDPVHSDLRSKGLSMSKGNGMIGFEHANSGGNRVDVKQLVSIIGYQLTAYIGCTNIQTVQNWLQVGPPEPLQARMKAALEVARLIAEVESDLVAQGFLSTEQGGNEPYRLPATMLRDADPVTARSILGQRVKKEFLDNVASDLPTLEQRLKKWIAQASMPPQTAYSVSLWQNRLSLSLVHGGCSMEQHSKWDKGEDWPRWSELIAEIPEMASTRTVPDLQTGFPSRYLRRAEKLKTAP